MARSGQTQQKRQRENKLREKAQLKRDRRQQRQAEKKRPRAQEDRLLSDQFAPAETEGADRNDPPLQAAST
jgi:hypothetical protein